MAADNTTVIDIVARVTDETESGSDSATRRVSKLEQVMKKFQTGITTLGRMTKMEFVMNAKDKASKVLSGVLNAGKRIAGKVWNVTLKAVDLVTGPIKGIMRSLANPIVAAAGFAGISLGIGDLINTYKDFEQGMANVKAITRGTDEDMAALTTTAKKLGAETTFSGQQVAGAMEFLAMAGWKTNAIISGMPGLLDLAAAGAVDVATAADVVSSTLAQFNMNASESGRVADVLAATATNSKTDVTGLGESLKYAGSQAGSLGYTIEDTALAIGLMGNRGIDASSAGTALRTTLARMAKQGELTGDETEEVAAAMNALGISLTDDAGKTKPLIQVMRDLRKGFSTLSETEKAAMATTLSGMYAQSGLLAIVNSSEDEFNTLTNAITGSAGAAKQMANTRMDTFAGEIEELSGAAETIKIEFMERLAPYLKDFVAWITDKMPSLQEGAKNVADSIARGIDGITSAIDNLVNSSEWQEAETLWDKIKVAWDKLIAEPFDRWWNGEGKGWLMQKMSDVGRGLGSALKTGILAILGIDSEGAISDGLSIGKSFISGFSDGFDGNAVGEAFRTSWGKLKVAWNELIAEPFDTWWNGEGKAWLADKMQSIGSGIGGALKTGILAILGFEPEDAVTDGKSIGKSFMDGFIEGFDGKVVAEAITNALKGIFKDAAKILPGGEDPSATSGLSALLVGGAALRVGKTAWGVGKGVSSVVKGGKGIVQALSGASKVGAAAAAPVTAVGATGIFGGIKTGSQIFKAANAANAGSAAQSALTFARAGQMGKGVQVGARIAGAGAKIGSAASKAIPIVGGLMSLGEMGYDAYQGVGKAQEWTGSDSVGNKIASGAGAFLGGTDAGVFDKDKSTLGKVGSVAGGALKGAGIGAAVGTIVPGIGTAIGAGVGAGVGAIGSAIGGENIAKAFSTAGKAIGNFFTKALPDAFGKLWGGISGFFTQTVPAALSTVGTAISNFFMQTIPEKWGELWSAVGNFFSQTVPFALGYVTAKIVTFFTETVPGFFGDLWGGITNFFTVQVPAAVETVSGSLTTFFTETVPGFFGNLWEDIQNFFTVEVPAAIESIGGALTTFFSETVPGFFSDLWDDAKNFFTVEVPAGIEKIGTALKTFFTETVPGVFSDLWASATSLFTETIPNVAKEIGDSVSGFFYDIRDKITGFFSGIWDGIVNFFGGAAESFSEGYNAGTTTAPAAPASANGGIFGAYADGGILGTRGMRRIADYTDSRGIMGRAHVGLVGEDGAEAIIPLTSRRRRRGLALWEKAGEMLGVKPYADGGIAGEPLIPNPAGAAMPGGAGTVTVPVTIGNVTLEIRIDPGAATDAESIMRVLKDNIANLTDEIARNIAVSLEKVFANMPRTAMGV